MLETIIKCDICGKPDAIAFTFPGDPFRSPVDLCPEHAVELVAGLTNWIRSFVNVNVRDVLRKGGNLRGLPNP